MRKWSASQRKRFANTMRAKRNSSLKMPNKGMREDIGNPSSAVTQFLLHARAAHQKAIKSIDKALTAISRI